MVVFVPSCDPAVVLQVISTVALTLNLTSMFQSEFNMGSFAQFGSPAAVARIDHRTERTDFRNISHFAIRQHLDAENFTDEFILIDEHTEQSHATWWILSTEMDKLIEGSYLVVEHPGENYTLWQAHVSISTFANDYDGIAVGETFIDDIIPRWD